VARKVDLIENQDHLEHCFDFLRQVRFPLYHRNSMSSTLC
jgi:hypothetical protein